MVAIRKRRWETNGVTNTVWIADYRDNGGKRRQKTFKLKKDADRYVTSLRTELAEGLHVPASESITVAEACKLWLERTVREHLERSTYEDYEQVARLHIVPLIGTITLTNLTKARVERFRDELLETRSYDRAGRALLHFKMILDEATRLGKIGKNVAKDVKIKVRDRHKENVTILSKNELGSFLRAAEDLGEKEHAFARLLGLHGMRASELRGLPWHYVSLDAGTVYIGQRADRWNKLGSPKSTKSRRTIPLTPSALRALREWHRVSGGEGLVFPHQSGRPMYYSELVEHVFDPIMFAAELTVTNSKGKTVHRYSLHPFRHTSASIWIEQGFSAKRVSQLLGHSSIQVTFDLYGHLIDLRHSGSDLMRQVEEAICGEQVVQEEADGEPELHDVSVDEQLCLSLDLEDVSALISATSAHVDA
jgi:integrase